MKKSITVALILMATQFAFAENEEIQISTKCLKKITQFSTHFANASLPAFGDTPVSIGNVNVNSSAIMLSESGFADGKGSYELIAIDEGEPMTSVIEFTFRYMTEPHCSIVRMQLSDLN